MKNIRTKEIANRLAVWLGVTLLLAMGVQAAFRFNSLSNPVPIESFDVTRGVVLGVECEDSGKRHYIKVALTGPVAGTFEADSRYVNVSENRCEAVSVRLRQGAEVTMRVDGNRIVELEADHVNIFQYSDYLRDEIADTKIGMGFGFFVLLGVLAAIFRRKYEPKYSKY